MNLSGKVEATKKLPTLWRCWNYDATSGRESVGEGKEADHRMPEAIVPPREKAKRGVSLLKESVLELLKDNPEGLRNVEIASRLDIHSDFLGNQKDYFSWSILGLLVNEKKVVKKGRKYFLVG